MPTLRPEPPYRHGSAEKTAILLINLGTPEGDRIFIDAAQAAGFSGLAGHRAIGGVRASIYNGMTLAAVEELAGFMDTFRRQRRR